MTVGIIQVDGKYPNLALMKLASYYIRQGEQIALSPIEAQDANTVFVSKVFNFTDAQIDTTGMVRGGTGWPDQWQGDQFIGGLADLPAEVEHTYPDCASRSAAPPVRYYVTVSVLQGYCNIAVGRRAILRLF